MFSARSWYFALTLPAPVANKVLLLLGNVDLQIETAEGLVFCPSDPNDSDFMIDNEGKLWAGGSEQMAGQVRAAASRVLPTVLSVKLCSAAMRANIMCIVVTFLSI